MRALIAAVLVAAAPATVAAQIDFGVRGGLALPTDDFGSEEGERAGFAETGFTVGLEGGLGLPAAGLSGIASVDLFVNGAEDTRLAGPGGPITLERDGYWIVPVLAGLRYDLPATVPGLGVFAAAQLGAVFFQPGDMELSGGGGAEFDLATGLAFAFGGGIVAFDRWELAARYYPFGEMEIDGEATGGVLLTDLEQPVSVLGITLGIRL